ncbi:unnamed protein product [Lampetra fluviatilis]
MRSIVEHRGQLLKGLLLAPSADFDGSFESFDKCHPITSGRRKFLHGTQPSCVRSAGPQVGSVKVRGGISCDTSPSGIPVGRSSCVDKVVEVRDAACNSGQTG